MVFKHFCTSAIIEEGRSRCRSWERLGVQYISDRGGLVDWRLAFIDPSSGRLFSARLGGYVYYIVNRAYSMPIAPFSATEGRRTIWHAMHVSIRNIVYLARREFLNL